MGVDRKFHWVALVVASLLTALAHGQTQAPTRPEDGGEAVIRQVEVGGEKGATTVRVTGEGVWTLHTEQLSGPDRLVLDFANARLSALHPAAGGAVGPVRRIRTGQFKPNVARVVVDLEGMPVYRIENGEGSVTVVFGAASASAAEAPPAAPRAVMVPARVVRANPAPVTQQTAPAFGASSTTAGAPMEAANVLPDSFQNGLLTFRAKDQPLQAVLNKISGIANVPILVAEEVKGEQVSVEFRNCRLDEALRQILRNYDFFFSYGSSSDTQQNPTLRMVWVYPPNHGSGMD